LLLTVEDRDAGQTHAVHRGLPRGGIAVDIADIRLLHETVIDTRILSAAIAAFAPITV
jgi:hypothetical protein